MPRCQGLLNLFKDCVITLLYSGRHGFTEFMDASDIVIAALLQ